MEKRISTLEDMETWKRSAAHDKVWRFVARSNDKIKGTPIPFGGKVDCNAFKIVDGVFEEIDKLAEETRLNERAGQQRFGNTAFREFFQLVEEGVPRWIKALEDQIKRSVDPAAALDELSTYLTESLGSKERIDYGTGHELSFMAFACILEDVCEGCSGDDNMMIFHLFKRYLDTVRKLQKRYRLEPAGSHGVWGLDDYHFIPFLWGSSQLIGHESFIPTGCIVDEACVGGYSSEFLYFDAVKHITTMKFGAPFSEHSPMLYNISGVESWSKINCGLQKMYKKEVLGKLPVAQHFLFGRHLKFGCR